jgi:MFS family permease
MNSASRSMGYRFEPEGLPARVGLAVLMSAGIAYAALGPVIVTGLALSETFSNETAGYVLSANMYGTAVGGLLVALVVRRLNWRITSAILLVALVGVDCLSAWIGVSQTLYPIRFLHGLVGGALMGAATSVVARTENPERTFALAIFVQLSLGGLGAAILTPLLLGYGTGIVWLSLVLLTLSALFVLPLLDSYPVMADTADQSQSGQRAPSQYVLLALLAIFIFQAGQFSLFAYELELGRHYGFETEFVSLVLASALWGGGLMALVVAWWGTRIGRLIPMCVGVFGMAACAALFLLPIVWTYLVAAVGFGVCFSLAIPYLLGMGSEMDNSGQIAAVGSFINSLGLATGPAIAAGLLDGEHYERVLMFSCAALLVSAIVGVPSARMLDQRSTHSRVTWE